MRDEVLEFGEIETPKPGPSEVLVNGEAAGVNFIDTYRRSGVYPMEYPHVVGVEGTGYIAEVGEGIRSCWPGSALPKEHSGTSDEQPAATNYEPGKFRSSALAFESRGIHPTVSSSMPPGLKPDYSSLQAAQPYENVGSIPSSILIDYYVRDGKRASQF